jgi:hypothetical protein
MTDAQAEVSLLKEARSIAIDTAAKSEQIKAMTAEQALLLQQAQEYAKEGRGIVEMYDKSTLEIEARTGKAYDKWMKKVIAGYTDAGKAFGDGIREALVLPPGTSSKGDGKSDYGRGRGTNGPETAPKTVTPKTAAGRREVEDNTDYNANGVIGAANGFLGNVSRPTKFTVGEVANETVAVLRNPRSASMAGMGGGGGGGTVNVNININGGGDIDAKKLQEWGAQIQRATLAALDRKTSLLGLRQP